METVTRTFDQRADEARALFARRYGLRLGEVSFRLLRLSDLRWDAQVSGYASPYETCFEGQSSEAALSNLLEWLAAEAAAGGP